MTHEQTIEHIIKNALLEDIGDGDHSSLASVPENATGKAKLLVKDGGIIAGIELAQKIFAYYDPTIVFNSILKDGDSVQKGEIAFTIEGKSRSILATERLVLNFMQRMSGIATQTHRYAQLIAGTNAKLLDTRKTTPGIRYMEKWAVRIGGGYNHRYALYDMIMLKDNHIDYAGGIAQAIERTNDYLKRTQKQLKIEIEVRNEQELDEVLAVGNVDRIMLDNFSVEDIKRVLPKIPKTFETEASGGITTDTIREYAETGVDFISVGALTHSFKSLDLSLKADYAL
ncbi:MAG TPA: carboxylating nicotinate-nucleotide diphosphorylase [Crocinitomicaceae bacterium]|nr:carboxylating nicotinate-nucleotide diphosphorylase [Crocinitomicaceae bacterium]